MAPVVRVGSWPLNAFRQRESAPPLDKRTSAAGFTDERALPFVARRVVTIWAISSGSETSPERTAPITPSACGPPTHGRVARSPIWHPLDLEGGEAPSGVLAMRPNAAINHVNA